MSLQSGTNLKFIIFFIVLFRVPNALFGKSIKINTTEYSSKIELWSTVTLSIIDDYSAKPDTGTIVIIKAFTSIEASNDQSTIINTVMRLNRHLFAFELYEYSFIQPINGKSQIFFNIIFVDSYQAFR